MRTYTQEEIDYLIKCPKVITNPPKKEMVLVYGHYRNSMNLHSTDGTHNFFVFMRKHAMFAENFTIGLDYIPNDGSGHLCLLRCNGPHGGHTNELLTDTHHFGYHIHVAKDYNINNGRKSELYAELTDRYATFEDALAYFIEYCNIIDAEKYFLKFKQLTLFTEEGSS